MMTVGKGAHTVFLLMLTLVAVVSVTVVGIRGFTYYTAPITERPFHPLHELLKPAGRDGHGFGIIGTAMILGGVMMYSTRKRFRRVSHVGRLSRFLEFHIFLCSLGPLLIIYHTTFKIGGIVAVSFWSMIAVALSGVIGRYLYVQVPRGIQGNELTENELAAQRDQLGKRLLEGGVLSEKDIAHIDAIATPPRPPASMSVMETVRYFILDDLTRRRRIHAMFEQLGRRGVPAAAVRRLRGFANRRVVLARRIAFLEQLRRLFHYWHVVHLPFSIIMFLILAVHVGVAMAFGYVWPWA
jgi:hypothetical protein